MKVLFDQGTPVPLRRFLVGHDVQTAYELNWNRLVNGDLIAQAEAAGFDVLITTDQNLRYQQNLKDRRIAILVLRSTSWPRLQRHVTQIAQALDALDSGSFSKFEIDEH